jgi:hypothetical protein
MKKMILALALSLVASTSQAAVDLKDYLLVSGAFGTSPGGDPFPAPSSGAQAKKVYESLTVADVAGTKSTGFVAGEMKFGIDSEETGFYVFAVVKKSSLLGSLGGNTTLVLERNLAQSLFNLLPATGTDPSLRSVENVSCTQAPASASGVRCEISDISFFGLTLQDLVNDPNSEMSEDMAQELVVGSGF